MAACRSGFISVCHCAKVMRNESNLRGQPLRRKAERLEGLGVPVLDQQPLSTGDGRGEHHPMEPPIIHVGGLCQQHLLFQGPGRCGKG